MSTAVRGKSFRASLWFLALASGASALGACSSSSSSSGTNGTGADGGSSSGGSSGSGSGSSSSGSSSGGSSSGGSSSGSSSSGSGSGSGSGGVETTLASGLAAVASFMEIGSTLYWADPSASKIYSLSTAAAGTPTTIYAQAGVDGNLATDGTRIYFGNHPSFGFDQIQAISLTGANPTTVAAGFSLNTDYNGEAMFYATGNLFIAGSSPAGILEIPTNGADEDGGTQPGVIEQSGSYILWVDSTEIYYGTSSAAYYAPLATGTPSTIYTPTGTGNPSVSALTVVGGTAYFLGTVVTAGSTASYTATLYTSVGGATGTSIATYDGEEANAIAADSAGAFVLAGGAKAGIYSVNLSTGAQTSFDVSSTAQANNTGQYAMDSKNLYFISGPNAGPFSIVAVTR